MPKTQSRLSLDDFLVPVEMVIPAGANPVLTNDVVQFQFVNGGLPARIEPTEDPNLPQTTGWLDGFWIDNDPGPALAGILVGPGGTAQLPTGRWAVWIRIVDSPTVPVAAIDQLTIT